MSARIMAPRNARHAVRPASEKQVAAIRKMAATKDLTGLTGTQQDDMAEVMANVGPGLDSQTASRLITALIAAPWAPKPRAAAPARTTHTPEAPVNPVVGFYIRIELSDDEMDDGEPVEVIYQVVENRARTGTYANRLTPTADRKSARWVYAKGLGRDIAREGLERLSLERAAAFGRGRHYCAVCGKRLDRLDSQKRGIGPYCAKKL